MRCQLYRVLCLAVKLLYKDSFVWGLLEPQQWLMCRCADVTQETLNHQLDLCVASCPIYPMTIIKCLRQMVVQWKANPLWLYKKPDVGTITFWWLLSPAQVLMLKACLLSNWNEVIKTLIIENNSHLCLIMWSVAFAVEIPVHLCNVWFNFRVKIFIQSFIGLIYSISPR